MKVTQKLSIGLVNGRLPAKLAVVLAVFCAVCLNTGGSLQKDYQLAYFKYKPLDLDVEVYTDNGSKSTENTDYIIPKIDPSTGDARLFLVKSSPLEREKFSVRYRYKVVFYKPQKIEGRTYKVPVYAFKLSYNDGQVVVRYDNQSEKTFDRNLDNNIYYVKDYNGGDFDISEKMRVVKFTGRIRKLTGGATNYVDVPSGRSIFVRLERKEDDIFTNYFSSALDVPLNREITVGLSPYILGNSDSYERYRLKYLVANGAESTNLVVHFAEVWNNMYEQKLVFEDDGCHADFYFDESLYNLKYTLGRNFFVSNISYASNWVIFTNTDVLSNSKIESRVNSASNVTVMTNLYVSTNTRVLTNSRESTNLSIITNMKVEGPYTIETAPFTLPIIETSGQLFQMKLAAKDYAIKYLNSPAAQLNFWVNPGVTAVKLADEVKISNEDIVRIVDEGSVYITPRFNQTPFAVMSTPETARIRYKKLEPLSAGGAPDWIDLGESPVFLTNLDYGKYQFVAEWYATETNRYQIRVLSKWDDATVEFSSYSLNGGGNSKEVRFLTNNNVAIPYVQFSLDSDTLRTKVVRVETNTNIPAPVTNALSNSNAVLTNLVVTNTNLVVISRFKTNLVVVNTYLTNVVRQDIVQTNSAVVQTSNAVVKTVSNVNVTGGYTIQLAAYRKQDRSWSGNATQFVQYYRAAFRRLYGDGPSINCSLAYKRVKGAVFVVVITPYYGIETARTELQKVLGIIGTAFIISASELEDFRQ